MTSKMYTLKQYRILLASLLLLIIVYAKEYSWAYLGTTGFWIIALCLILYSFVLVIWVLTDVIIKIREKRPLKKELWIPILSLILIIISIAGMK